MNVLNDEINIPSILKMVVFLKTNINIFHCNLKNIFNVEKKKKTLSKFQFYYFNSILTSSAHKRFICKYINVLLMC